MPIIEAYVALVYVRGLDCIRLWCVVGSLGSQEGAAIGLTLSGQGQIGSSSVHWPSSAHVKARCTLLQLYKCWVL